ncbi:CPBP family intramembrane glutamic endopeptidase [Metabacillus niabensis]|uniref:Membrane protease YdiL (CAAX protease family) n=1 Tax=Metabacillus niabensis TaxID=324854 RepID=A0ABT9YZN7_9BACI|nr:type II CAAX endopeptidase family protein [Metabacillus niabensis]MDQ0225067.1 membrane protease YdiL (CAAX protease family) [Metabacillus niabensis]
MFKNQSEQIKQLSDKQVLQSLYFTQFLLIIISIVMSIFLFKDRNDFLKVWEYKDNDFLLFGFITALIVIIIDYIMMKLLPSHLLDDGGVNEKIFKNRNVLHIIFLTALIAFSEELLFRGIIQTHFGLLIASLIFAILHFRYVTKIVLFIMVVAVSFFLGIVYELTNTIYSTMIAHFIIDLVFAIQIRRKFLKGVKRDNE